MASSEQRPPRELTLELTLELTIELTIELTLELTLELTRFITAPSHPQYPHEAEICFTPLTGLEMRGTRVDGSLMIVEVEVKACAHHPGRTSCTPACHAQGADACARMPVQVRVNLSHAGWLGLDPVEQTEEVRAFKRADEDGSGMLDMAEFRQMAVGLIPGYVDTDDALASIFRAADANADGRLSFDEFTATCSHLLREEQRRDAARRKEKERRAHEAEVRRKLDETRRLLEAKHAEELEREVRAARAAGKEESTGEMRRLHGKVRLLQAEGERTKQALAKATERAELMPPAKEVVLRHRRAVAQVAAAMMLQKSADPRERPATAARERQRLKLVKDLEVSAFGDDPTVGPDLLAILKS